MRDDQVAAAATAATADPALDSDSDLYGPYDGHGYNAGGFDRAGVHRATDSAFDPDGFDEAGYDRDGYHATHWRAPR